MNLLPSRRPVKAEGERPTVICLDPGLGVTLQRQSLPERLRLRNRVLAPELRGYAASRASGTGEPLSLDAEAASITPLVDAILGKVYLMGHDYGAAVALRLALARRERIAGLVLYEPTLFSLLLADPGSRDAAMDIAVLRLVLGRYLDAGDWFRAALRYVEHWSGRDAWQRLSTPQRAAIAWRMPELCARLDATLADPTHLSVYAAIDIPVLLLSGTRTRASTGHIAQLLARTLPRAEWHTVDGAGLRGIDSHPEAIEREIADFLARHRASWYRDPEPTGFVALPAFAYRHRGTGHG
ncbi:MAG: alpha/beta fold hydrolase [Gammaproteobacteria bacterium]